MTSSPWFDIRPDVATIKKEAPHAYAASLKAHNLVVEGSAFRVEKVALNRARKLVRKMPNVAEYFCPRAKVRVAQALMQDNALRNAVNYTLAKAGVPCYFHMVRMRKGGKRENILHCTWHHDGQWFMQKPVGTLDTIIATGRATLLPKSGV